MKHIIKLIITEKEIIGRDFPFEMGDNVYEMYVTDTIALPLHSLLYINKKYSGVFPLEIKESLTKTPDLFILYKVKKIVK